MPADVHGMNLSHAMQFAESSCRFFTHVTIEHASLSVAEVDNYQAIQHIGKFAIHVEAEELASDLCVLLEEDGKAFAVEFNIGDRLRELFEVAQDVTDGAAVPTADTPGAKWTTGLDEIGEFVILTARFEK